MKCLFSQDTGQPLTIADRRQLRRGEFPSLVILGETNPANAEAFGSPILLMPDEATQFMIGQESWCNGADDEIITFQFANGQRLMMKREYRDIVEVGEERDDVIK
jgi:hypothetical protein